MTKLTKEQPKPNTLAYIYWMIRNWGNSPKQGKIWEDNNASFEGISCL